MAGERQKVSFILHFVRTEAPGVGPWRGQLQEVETGDRRTLTTLAALGGALAAHGVTLAPDLGAEITCPVCGTLYGGRA